MNKSAKRWREKSRKVCPECNTNMIRYESKTCVPCHLKQKQAQALAKKTMQSLKRKPQPQAVAPKATEQINPFGKRLALPLTQAMIDVILMAYERATPAEKQIIFERNPDIFQKVSRQ